mgnify:CR=1 FL=1
MKKDRNYNHLPTYEEFTNVCVTLSSLSYSAMMQALEIQRPSEWSERSGPYGVAYYDLHRYMKRMPINFWIRLFEENPYSLLAFVRFGWDGTTSFKPFVYLKDDDKRRLLVGSPKLFENMMQNHHLAVNDPNKKDGYRRKYPFNKHDDRIILGWEMDRLLKKYQELRVLELLYI